MAHKKILVTLRHSLISQKPKTRAAVRSLGLRKINDSREHRDGPDVRGQIHKVRHLVSVDEVKS